MRNFIRNNRAVCVLSVLALISTAVLVYVSQEVYESQRSVQKMGRDVVRTQWDIRSLKAELAYLTRPDRLDEISTSSVRDGAPVSFMSSLSEMVSPASIDVPVPVKKPQRDKRTASRFDQILNFVGGDE